MGRALERGLPCVTGGHGGLTAEVTFVQRPEGSMGVKHVDTRERAIQRKDPEEAAGRAEDREGLSLGVSERTWLAFQRIALSALEGTVCKE